MHINKQLKEGNSSGQNLQKEMKFIDGNLTNEHKRLEIAQYEYEHLQYRLAQESNNDKQSELKLMIKSLAHKIRECSVENKALKLRHAKIQREFKSTNQNKLDMNRNTVESGIKELEYINEKCDQLEYKQVKRKDDLKYTEGEYQAYLKDYNEQLAKSSTELNCSKKVFEKLLKAYIANDNTLENIQFDFTLLDSDPSKSEKQKELTKQKEALEKEIKLQRIQLERLQSEQAYSESEQNRMINKLRREVNEYKAKLENHNKVEKQNELINLLKKAIEENPKSTDPFKAKLKGNSKNDNVNNDLKDIIQDEGDQKEKTPKKEGEAQIQAAQNEKADGNLDQKQGSVNSALKDSSPGPNPENSNGGILGKLGEIIISEPKQKVSESPNLKTKLEENKRNSVLQIAPKVNES